MSEESKVQGRQAAFRERLFDRYSRNLSVVTERCGHPLDGPAGSLYACPLCLRLFDRSALSAVDDERRLTLEHVPPKAVGGKPRVLTCGRCNKGGGRELDQHLRDRAEHQLLLQNVPGTEAHVKVAFQGGRTVAALATVLEGGGGQIAAEAAWTSPEDLAAWQSLAHEPFEAKVFPRRGYSNRRTSLCVLRAGYLTAFSVLAYGFARLSSMAVVRSQIQDPDGPYLPRIAVLPAPFVQQAGIVGMIVSPPEARCFFVVLKLQVPGSPATKVGVALPGPTTPGSDALAWLMEAASGGRSVPFQAKVFAGTRYVTDPEFAFAAPTVWKESCT